MPKKRLPWFKVWVGATRHEKVATLNDRTFRAWVELLDAASQQTVRGQFANTSAAAAVIRRPAALVKALIQARLIDQTEDGAIQMHDWPEWQRWRPEDAANDPDTPPDSPLIDSRLTHESLRNGSRLTPESHAIDSRPRASNAKLAKTETETKKKDGEEDVTTTAAAAVFSEDEQELVDAVVGILEPFSISHDPKMWRTALDTYGGLDLQVEAVKQADWLHCNRKRTCSAARYFEWLDRARVPPQRQPPGRPTPITIVRASASASAPPQPVQVACEDCGAETYRSDPDSPWCYPCLAARKKATA